MRKILLGLVAIVLIASACSDGVSHSEQDERSVKEIKEQPNLNEAAAIRNAIQNKMPEDTVNIGKFTFEATSHDFGTVKEGDVVEHVFKFTNTGKAPISISNARGSCGCTVPEWPKEPIDPGASNEIKVRFNSKGKSGRQVKPVTITANTWPAETRVQLVGTIEGTANAQTANQ